MLTRCWRYQKGCLMWYYQSDAWLRAATPTENLKTSCKIDNFTEHWVVCRSLVSLDLDYWLLRTLGDVVRMHSFCLFCQYWVPVLLHIYLSILSFHIVFSTFSFSHYHCYEVILILLPFSLLISASIYISARLYINYDW